jgi:hypothetical protein
MTRDNLAAVEACLQVPTLVLLTTCPREEEAEQLVEEEAPTLMRLRLAVAVAVEDTAGSNNSLDQEVMLR